MARSIRAGRGDSREVHCLAARQRNLLWSIAAVAGLAALCFAIDVLLFP